MRARIVPLAALLTMHLAHAPTLSACATAPREGETVAIADEEALIVHDPVAGVEHFIRRAAFRTAAREFGFLVPTPAVPTLTEAPEWLFARITVHHGPPVFSARRGSDARRSGRKRAYERFDFVASAQRPPPCHRKNNVRCNKSELTLQDYRLTKILPSIAAGRLSYKMQRAVDTCPAVGVEARNRRFGLVPQGVRRTTTSLPRD